MTRHVLAKTREVGEEKDFSSSVFHRHLSLNKTPTNPTCPKLSTCWRKGRRAVPRVVEGRLNSGCPVHISPLFLPINTGETRREEKWEEKRESKRGGRLKKRRSREENEKQRGEREEKKQSRYHHREPPASLPIASSSSANNSSHRRAALLPFFFLLLRPCHASTVHVACEQWRALFTQVGLSPTDKLHHM